MDLRGDAPLVLGPLALGRRRAALLALGLALALRLLFRIVVLVAELDARHLAARAAPRRFSHGVSRVLRQERGPSSMDLERTWFLKFDR